MPKSTSEFWVSNRVWRGKGIAQGVVSGVLSVYENEIDEVGKHFLKKKSDITAEISRYRQVLKESEAQLEENKRKVEQTIGKSASAIFDAHTSILQDPLFQEEIPRIISEKGVNAEAVIVEELQRLENIFSQMEDPFFRERFVDVKDVGKQLVNSLLNQAQAICPINFEEDTILFTKELTPSDAISLSEAKIRGIVTEKGGATSHAAIIARSLGIPAVVGVKDILNHVETGDFAIVDANAGFVFINPDESIIEEYAKLEAEYRKYKNQLNDIIDLPAITQDGEKITLLANIARVSDVTLAKRWGAEGVGLFRTELPFLLQGRLLTEIEQTKLYTAVAEEMKGRQVIIRTLDFGGDKMVPFLGVKQEANPFLGWRSIRISLEEREIFRVQLRSILRANVHKNIKVMFPMISSYEELQSALAILQEARRELNRLNIQFNDVEVGIMIEVPSAALIAEILLEHVDFCSIGTNDLIQYTLAVDRYNDKVSNFYQPLNPGVLRLIQEVIDTANKVGKPVSVCGEMAGVPFYTILFLGMGLRIFSMSSPVISAVKEIIRRVTIPEVEEVAKQVLASKTTEQAKKILRDKYKDISRREVDGIRLVDYEQVEDKFMEVK